MLPRLLRSRRSVFKYFSGAFYIYTYLIPLRRRRSLGSILKHFSGAGEVFIHTFPVPRLRSAYLHLFGAGEAGEVFIYTRNVYLYFALRQQFIAKSCKA